MQSGKVLLGIIFIFKEDSFQGINGVIRKKLSIGEAPLEILKSTEGLYYPLQDTGHC